VCDARPTFVGKWRILIILNKIKSRHRIVVTSRGNQCVVPMFVPTTVLLAQPGALLYAAFD
jgi:hypothetical protein